MRAQMFGAALRGRSGGTVTLTDETISDVGVYPDAASAFYTLANDGAIESVISGVTTQIGTWLIGSTSYSSYEGRFTVDGVPGAWTALSSDLSEGAIRSSYGVTEKVVLAEVRDAATQTVRDTATIHLSAEVTA